MSFWMIRRPDVIRVWKLESNSWRRYRLCTFRLRPSTDCFTSRRCVKHKIKNNSDIRACSLSVNQTCTSFVTTATAEYSFRIMSPQMSKANLQANLFCKDALNESKVTAKAFIKCFYFKSVWLFNHQRILKQRYYCLHNITQNNW